MSCFFNKKIDSTDLTPVLTNSPIDAGGEWVLVCEEASFISKFKMRFQNIENTLAFYKRYANCVGFSVRKSSTTKNKSGKIWKVFVFSKQGYREPRKTPPQSAVALANAISRARENVEERRVKRRRVETREGCNARMVGSSMNDCQFEVCTFHTGHVHPLVTPSRRQFLRSSRNISPIHKDFICKYGRANVRASKVYHLLNEQVRGYEYVGCD